MSIESIIGITSGLIAIAGVLWQGFSLLKRKFGECPTLELFTKLTKKELTDVNRRAILKELNKSSLFRNTIKKEYIQGFVLGARGKEDVLFDICDSNDIVPTSDICKAMLGYDRPALISKYQNKRQSRQEPLSENKKTAPETRASHSRKGEQTVYMSELLKTRFPQTCDSLIRILQKNNVKYAFLKGTKDIWCRDYMPVQTASGKLVQFRYDPSYLKGNPEWEATRTDVDEVGRLNDISVQKSDIVLDGGNVLICEDRAIISDRIFSENPQKDESELLSQLSKLLESEIIVIPSLKSKDEDMTGHADGMVRFVNRNTIIGNRLSDEYQYIQKGMNKILGQYNLQYIDMPFFQVKDREHPLNAMGIYVNYLEVNNLIVMPVFGREEDEQALSILKETFPEKVIETINYNDVAQEGGLLNCSTWVFTA